MKDDEGVSQESELCGGLGGRGIGEEVKDPDRCCPVHGFIGHSSRNWKGKNKKTPHCPDCERILIKVAKCPNHGPICCKDMIWKNDEPYCPKCDSSLKKS